MRTMKLYSLAVGLGVFIAIVGRSAFADSAAPVLKLGVSVQKTPFRIGDDIPVKVVLENVSDKTVKTALEFGVTNGKWNLFFEVRPGTDEKAEPLKYVGEQFDLTWPPAVIQIKPGGRISKAFNLVHGYDLWEPGPYSVRAVYVQPMQTLLLKQGIPNAITPALRSDPVHITITDDNKVFERKTEVLRQTDKGMVRHSHAIRVFRTKRGDLVHYENPAHPRPERRIRQLRGHLAPNSRPILAVSGDGHLHVLYLRTDNDKQHWCWWEFLPNGKLDRWQWLVGARDPALVVTADGNVEKRYDVKR